MMPEDGHRPRAPGPGADPSSEAPAPLRLRLHDRMLRTQDRPLVMGILNLTPDSFSDGGRHQDMEAAVAHARRLADEGADLLDLGGESTRPGAEPVPPADEQARVLPVVERLVDEGYPLPLSVDTRRSETARAALDLGAHLINDVSALADPCMAPALLAHDAPVVLMHMQGTPQTMQAAPEYGADPVAEIIDWLETRCRVAVDAGIRPDGIVVDPGIGFGKRTGDRVDDNLRILSELPRFHRLGRPVLVGASRKRFIGTVGDIPVDQRLPGSLAAALAATWAGAQILRVHDVAATVQATKVAARLDPSAWTTWWRRDH